MARDRFSDLERIYDALALAKVDPSSLPANLDFVKYAKWRRGEGTPITITRPNLNGEANVGVICFGLAAADDGAKKLVQMSGRSKTFFDGLANKSLFGVETATLTDYATDSGYVSAKAHLGRKVAGTTQTSHITGRRYKKKTSDSYSVPIGQTTANNRYQQVIRSILAVPAITNTYVVSFSPEEFRRD